jgi:predicted DNA-binding transcriptional regulator YafY
MGNVTTRLFALIQLLQSRPVWTAAELATELDVSERTVHRYMKDLEEMGIPIYAERGRGGGFALMRGYTLPPLIFTPEEATVLAMGAKLMRELWGLTYGDAITSVTAKLHNVLPDDLRQEVADALRTLVVGRITARDYRPWESTLHTLRSYIADRRRLRITYRAFTQEESCREVNPYALAFRGGYWYLVAYCHLREAMRTFRVDRLREAVPLEEGFTPPRDFDVRAYLEETMQPQIAHEVVVHLDERVAPLVREYAGDWMGLTDHEDGSVTARFGAEDLNWAAGWVLSYGTTARVLEPPELVERVREEAEAVARRYRPAASEEDPGATATD